MKYIYSVATATVPCQAVARCYSSVWVCLLALLALVDRKLKFKIYSLQIWMPLSGNGTSHTEHAKAYFDSSAPKRARAPTHCMHSIFMHECIGGHNIRIRNSQQRAECMHSITMHKYISQFALALVSRSAARSSDATQWARNLRSHRCHSQHKFSARMRDTLSNLVPNANAREFMARRRRHHHRSTDVLNMCCVDGMHGASILWAVERADDLLKTFTVRLEFRAKQFRVTKH